MIFSSLRLPLPGPLLWGLLLLTGNRSRRLLCSCSVPHTHTHLCTHVYTCSGVQYIQLRSHVRARSNSPSSLHPLKPGDSLLNLMPRAKPRSLQDLCPHLSVKTPGCQVGASYCRWKPRATLQVTITECTAEGEEPTTSIPVHINLSTPYCSRFLSPPETQFTT